MYAMRVNHMAWIILVSGISVSVVTATVTIDNNGYRNLLIAISDDVDEDTTLLTRLNDTFTAASQKLYRATK